MIYCLEDERNIRELIVYTLESSGFHAAGFSNGTDLFNAIGYYAAEGKWSVHLKETEKLHGDKGYSGHYGDGEGVRI